MGAHDGRPVRFMLVRTTCLCAVLLALTPVFSPVLAMAAGWPLAEGSAVLLGYGQVYTGPDGATRTHSGLDVAAPAGVSILGLVDGTVTFAGRIPAGEGSSMLAVTVEGAVDGLRYTVMPLETLDVARGEVLSLGDPLGSLAATGDGSSEAPHVHISVRRGDTYLDPQTVLTPPAASVEEPPAPAEDEPQPVVEEPVPAPTVEPLPVASPEVADVVAITPPVDPTPYVSRADVASAEVAVPGEMSVRWDVEDTGDATDSGTTVASRVNAGGAVSLAPNTTKSRIAARDPLAYVDVVYMTANSPGEEAVGSGRVPVGRGLPRSVVLLGGLPAIAALWPLTRRERSVFASCVRARGDDVAAAVGR